MASTARETPEETQQKHLLTMLSQMLNKEHFHVTPKQLDKSVIERYAKHSPTAKVCLEAYNKFDQGFGILHRSNYRNPDCFKLIVEGDLLEHTFQGSIMQLQEVNFERYMAFATHEAKGNPYALLLSQRIDADLLKAGIRKLEKWKEVDAALKRKMIGHLHCTMGAGFAMSQQYAEALQCSEEASKVYPENIGYLIDQSKCHINLSQLSVEQAKRSHHYTAAFNLCEKFLESAPKCDRLYPSALYNKAYILSERGDQRWIGVYQMAKESEEKQLPFLDKLDAIGKMYLDLKKPVACCGHCGIHAEVRRKWKLCPCGDAYYCGAECQELDRASHSKVCTAGTACSYCHRPPPATRNLKTCVACRGAAYCDKDCQRKHWKVHKLNCNAK